MYIFSLIMVWLTTGLLLAGGLVTSHEAGLAVPDWPLSYGQFFPPMVGNIFWEHGHRMIAGFVGVMTLIFAATIQIKEKRMWLKRLAWGAFALVVLQALLGGLTVLMLLPPAVSIAHACTAQTFYCLIVGISFFLSKEYLEKKAQRYSFAPQLKHVAVFLTGLVYLQLILGATVRHTGHIVWWHAGGAMLIFLTLMVFWLHLSRTAGGKENLQSILRVLTLFIFAQILLGIGAFILTMMMERGVRPIGPEIWITAVHQTLGAIILAVSLLLTLKVSVFK